MEIQDTRESVNIIFLKTLPLICTIAGIVLGSFLYHCDAKVFLRNVIVIAILTIVFLFMLEQRMINSLSKDTDDLKRFVSLFIVFLICALLFPLFPNSGWCFLVVFAGLSLYSDKFLGFYAGVLLLTITILLSQGTDMFTYLVYLIPGLTAVVLFSDIDEKFRVMIPLVVSLMFQFLLLFLSEVFLQGEGIRLSAFVIPLLNIIVSLAVLLILLKRVSYILLYESHDRYMDINDPEFELLTRLKEYDRKEYEHSLYTAVLASKLAYSLKLSAEKCKACAYYHNIGLLEGENTFKNCEKILTENDIPMEVIELIREYMTSSHYVSKETGVLLFSEAIITSISYFFEQNPQKELDVPLLVNGLVDNKINSGILDESLLNFDDMRIIKKTLIEEKLFYDFLR